MKTQMWTRALGILLTAGLLMGAGPTAKEKTTPVAFEKGRLSTTFSGAVTEGGKAIYTFNADKGQVASLAITSAQDNARVSLRRLQEGMWYAITLRNRSFSGVLPKAEWGQYRLEVESTHGEARFDVFLGIAMAPTAPVTVEPKGFGKLSFTVKREKGSPISKVHDLETSIAGCIRRYDSEDEESGTYDASHFQVVDSVAANGEYFVVLLASAGTTCNVQSRLGGTSALTLMWLHLDKGLALKARKVIQVEDGYGGVSASVSLGWPQAEGDFMGIGLDEGRFSFRVYRRRGDKRAVDTLRYDQRRAQEGIQVTTHMEKAPPEDDDAR